MFVLKRGDSTARSTPGTLYHTLPDGSLKKLCHTLEDVVRPDGVKVAGQTAIPAGTYKLLTTMSNRFKKLLPLLVGVPNFAGVRIHGGNTSENTEGCLLVGDYRNSPDRISNCAPALARVMALIAAEQTQGRTPMIEIVPAARAEK